MIIDLISFRYLKIIMKQSTIYYFNITFKNKIFPLVAP